MKRLVQVFLCIVFAFGVVRAQEDAAQTKSESVLPTEDFAILSEAAEAVVPTDTICNICACDNGTVDCSGKGIQGFFTLNDWEGLKDLNITKVDLSFNALSTVTSIAELPIQNLTLSSCQIDKLQNFAFRRLSELAYLDLSHNSIATSTLSRRVFERGPPQPHHEPARFDMMRTLNLSYNDIHQLPQDLFIFMPGLTSLELSGNPLAYIDQVTQASLMDLILLKELRLASCELETLPEGLFRQHRRLQRLDLSNNRFTTIPPVLSEAVYLVYLNLNRNLMVNITANNALSSLTKLEELHLCRNSKLTSISENALGGLESLVSLHVCHNPRLTILDPGFLKWKVTLDEHEVDKYPLLRVLHLQSNNISQIPNHLLDRWDQLLDINVSNNPYNCDCSAKWMVSTLVPLIRASRTNDTLKNMYCKKPADVRGLSLGSLYSLGKTLECPESQDQTEVPTPDTAIILGIMIGILATFPIVLVVVLLWKRGLFSRCRRRPDKYNYYGDEENDAF